MINRGNYRKRIVEIVGRCFGLWRGSYGSWVTGSRQRGKTTRVLSIFSDPAYVNLEDRSLRRFAQKDPKALLAQYLDGVILDEVQHCPKCSATSKWAPTLGQLTQRADAEFASG